MLFQFISFELDKSLKTNEIKTKTASNTIYGVIKWSRIWNNTHKPAKANCVSALFFDKPLNKTYLGFAPFLLEGWISINERSLSLVNQTIFDPHKDNKIRLNVSTRKIESIGADRYKDFMCNSLMQSCILQTTRQSLDCDIVKSYFGRLNTSYLYSVGYNTVRLKLSICNEWLMLLLL